MKIIQMEIIGNSENTQISRTNSDIPNNTVNTNNNSNITNSLNNQSNNNITSNKQNSVPNESFSEPSETDLASFSTPIIDKRENRQNNIRITCSKINGITVKSNETFSFCNIVGKSTSEEGYKEADILVDGEIQQALGGGNCQVSTTLYNAILACNDLTVTEHHDHGKKVPYIEKGKDATIAYNSLDLKFKNNLPNDIKIYASTDGNNVTVRIVKIS